MRLGTRTLATRLKRLEKAARFARSRRPIFLALYDEPEAHIVGIQAFSGRVFDREEGEDMEALASRATAALGSARVGFAVYGDTFYDNRS